MPVTYPLLLPNGAQARPSSAKTVSIRRSYGNECISARMSRASEKVSQASIFCQELTPSGFRGLFEERSSKTPPFYPITPIQRLAGGVLPIFASSPSCTGMKSHHAPPEELFWPNPYIPGGVLLCSSPISNASDRSRPCASRPLAGGLIARPPPC